MTSSEELRRLNDDLGQPSATKLLAAARKKGLQVTKAQISELQESGVRQIFAKPAAQKGAIATNDENGVFQADLADLTQCTSKNNKDHSYFLLVVDVFSREVHTEPLESKKPQEVWGAFDTILGRFGKKPTRLDTDDGNEFSGFSRPKPKRRASWSKRRNQVM